MILAGDIGGTNARLAVFEVSEGHGLRKIVESDYRARDYGALAEIVTTFVTSQPLPFEHACFGVAGPVRQGRAVIANLPWIVGARALAQLLKLPDVSVINDLEAHAYAVDALPPGDFAVLQPGAANAGGNAAIIAAGTGLGQAGLYWDGERHHPFAGEGGHADFAPRNELEMELLRYLTRKFGRVSCERVVSGPGLNNVYMFLRDTGRAEEPAWLRDKLLEGADASAVIAQAGLDGKAEICERALGIFVSAYGAEAGNLALKLMATGGIFLGGGIAPKILAKLQQPTFIDAFLAKGRMQSLLETIPVRVILNDKAGLLGAARCAWIRATSGRQAAADSAREKRPRDLIGETP